MANRPEQRVIPIFPIQGLDDQYTEMVVDSSGRPVAPTPDTESQPTQIAHGQVTLPVVSGGSRLIVAGRTDRNSVLIVNSATNDVYLGSTAQVTISTGVRLPAGASISIPGSAAVYGINSSASTTQVVSYIEAF